MLEKENIVLVQRIRNEQDKLEDQEMKYNKQLEDVSSEHTNNLTQMGFLLANQKKVLHFIWNKCPCIIICW